MKKIYNEEKILGIDKMYTLADMEESEATLEPMVDGLVAMGDSLLVVAPSGFGKSLFVSYLALTLANPPPGGLFGLFGIPKPLKSLIIQSENSKGATADRLRMMLSKNPGLRAGANGVFVPERDGDCRLSGDFNNPGFMDVVFEMVEATNADIVIFDPLVSFLGNVSENEDIQMRRTLGYLTDIIDEMNIAAIVVHNMGKGGKGDGLFGMHRARGASAITDWAATILTMENAAKRAEGLIRVSVDKIRNFPNVDDFHLKRGDDLSFSNPDNFNSDKRR